MRVDIIRRPLRLAVNEHWCAKCGADVTGFEREALQSGICPLCRRKALVPAPSVLLADEYFIAQ